MGYSMDILTRAAAVLLPGSKHRFLGQGSVDLFG
jgi:hypothetical protein